MATANDRAALTAPAFIGRMLVVNLALAILFTLACLALSGERMAIASGLSGLAGVLDLMFLGFIVLRIMKPGSRRLGLALLLVAKFAVLAALVLVGIRMLSLDPAGVAAGFTSTVAAVIGCSAGVAVSGREVVL